MCLKQVIAIWFFAWLMANMLSAWMEIGSSPSIPNLSKRLGSQRVAQMQCDITVYSASMLDRVTVTCFLELQVTGPPASWKTYLEIDFWSSMSVSQSKSEKMVSLSGVRSV